MFLGHLIPRLSGVRIHEVRKGLAEGFLGHSSHSGKFIRRRRSWKRLFRWILLSVLGSDGLGAGFQFFCLLVAPHFA